MFNSFVVVKTCVSLYELTFKNKPSLRNITGVQSMTTSPDSPLLGFIEDDQSQFSQGHYFLLKQAKSHFK